MGIGLLKGGRGIEFNVLGKISLGWLATPLIAGLVSFVSLFFMDNVFKLTVFQNKIINSAEHIKEMVLTQKDSVTADSIELYQPLLFTIIILLAIVIIVLGIRLIRKNMDTKDNLSQDIKINYETQENLLKEELQKVNENNAKLEKEINFKRKEQMDIALNIINKNRFLEKLKSKIKKIINKPEAEKEELVRLKTLIVDNLSLDKDRERFNIYVNELNRDFYYRLLSRYPNLTENEQRLCSLVRLNLSSKEMASIINISTKSVEVNRHRLRKKMHLKREDNLTELISKL